MVKWLKLGSSPKTYGTPVRRYVYYYYFIKDFDNFQKVDIDEIISIERFKVRIRSWLLGDSKKFFNISPFV